MIDILKINFDGIIEYESRGYSDCASHRCDDMGICRCYTIENAWVEDGIDLMAVTNIIYNHIFGNPNDVVIKREITINSIIENFDINKYFINRILTLHQLYLPDSWTVEYGGGYYGDEIDGVYMDVGTSINIDLDMLLSDNKTKIEYLLNKEYGYIDSRLINKEWDLDIIEVSDIIFPQKEHYDNVHQGLLYYNDTVYDLPKGILRKDGNKYKVVDGYHRIKNTREKFIEAIIAI